MSFLSLIFFLLALPALAVIKPAFVSQDSAIVMLKGPRFCSGFAIGLNPLMVMTAKHCVKAGAVILNDETPQKIYSDENFESFENDIAILIFSQRTTLQEKDLFLIKPVKFFSGMEMTFCGFGGIEPKLKDKSYGTRRCGKSQLVLEKIFAVSPIQRLLQQKLAEFGPNSRLAFGPTGSIVQEGDSGGPIFLEGKIVVGVLSYFNTWIIEGIEQPYLTYGWRIDHPLTLDLLRQVRSEWTMGRVREL